MADVQQKLGVPFPPKLAIGTRVRIEIHGTELLFRPHVCEHGR